MRDPVVAALAKQVSTPPPQDRLYPSSSSALPPLAQIDVPPLRAEVDRDKFRAALEKIASADLKRTSAGWLVDIAKEALK